MKYRGIFINDEAPALSGWAREKFGGFNHQFYAQVFELLLRLKGNYLWPAMWGNAFADDDPLNAALADEYGIVDGHVAPRADDARAGRVAALRHRARGTTSTNAEALRAFWARGHPPHGGATRTSSRSACAATATSR